MDKNIEEDIDKEINVGTNFMFNLNKKLGKGSFGVIYKGTFLILKK
jgi:hypothetical protein